MPVGGCLLNRLVCLSVCLFFVAVVCRVSGLRPRTLCLTLFLCLGLSVTSFNREAHWKAFNYIYLAGMTRRCPGLEGRTCGKFRSSETADPHSLCSECRGPNCNEDRKCEECIDWDEDQWIRFRRRGKYHSRKTTSSLLAGALSTIKMDQRSTSMTPPPAQLDRMSKMEDDIKQLKDTLSSFLASFAAGSFSMPTSLAPTIAMTTTTTTVATPQVIVQDEQSS